MSLIELPPPPSEELTLDTFWGRHGDKIGSTREQFEVMWQVPDEHMDPDFDYHNPGHPKEMLWPAMRLADFYETQGLRPGRKVITAAVLFHDAGYHEDHTALGYDSKEEYAADIFKKRAESLGYTPEETEQVAQAIIATRFGEVPKTIEGVILVMSDIANVGGDYVTEFTTKTAALARESRKKSEALGKPFDQQTFTAVSIGVLTAYLNSLAEQQLCDTSEFVGRAKANLRRFLQEAAEAEGKTVDEYLQQINSPTTTKVLS